MGITKIFEGKKPGHKESEKHSFNPEKVRELSLPWVLGLPSVEITSDFRSSKTVRESGCPIPVLEVIRVHGKVMK